MEGLVIINQSNLVVVIGWMVFLLWGLFGCHIAVNTKAKKNHFSLPLSWYLACVLFTFLGIFIFEDFAKLSLHNDAVPFILVLLVMYFVVMGVGFVCICKQSHQFFPSIFIVLAALISFAIFGLSFSAYNKIEDAHPWHHLTTITLLIPPAIAGCAVHYCYIKEIKEKTHEEQEQPLHQHYQHHSHHIQTNGWTIYQPRKI